MRLRCAIPLFVLGLAIACGGCHSGQRLLEARVERDGEPVLETKFGVSDQATPADAWGRLAGKPFKAIGPITPEPGDANKAVLKGKIRISLTHTGTHFASSDVEQLRLTRVGGTDDQWEIPKEEVERAAKTAGFEK
jgi:hypothetical protein